MLKLAPLWLSDTKEGEKMMSGPVSLDYPILGGMRLLIFKNREKKGNSPDYVCYIAHADTKPKSQETLDDSHTDTPF